MPVGPGDDSGDVNELSFNAKDYELVPGASRQARIFVPQRLIVEAQRLRISAEDERLLVAPAEEVVDKTSATDGVNIRVEFLADDVEFETDVAAFYGDLQCHAHVVVKAREAEPISTLAFEHEKYRMRPNKKRSLLLIADSRVLKPGDIVGVSLEGAAPESYQIISEEAVLANMSGDARLLQTIIEVFPLQVGATATIVTRVNDFEARAELSCGEVKPAPPPPPPEGERALIRSIEFDPEVNPPTQTSFLSGVVKIYTEHPVATHYLGRDGAGAKTTEGGMLIKVLVAEAMFDELVRLKDQKGKILAIRGDKVTAMNYERDALRKRYGLRIHRAVSRMYAEDQHD
jgi:hypothetical protein